MRIIIAIFLIFSKQAFSYDVILSGGYGSLVFNEEKKGISLSSLEVYNPVLFENFHLGIGFGYFQAKLGNSNLFAQQFQPSLAIEDKDISLGLFPVYLTTKYEYFLDNNVSILLSSKLGISRGSKEYYFSEVLPDEGYKKAELVGSYMYGLSLGLFIYQKFIVSLFYEDYKITNYHSFTKYFLEEKIANSMTVSGIRLAYVIRE